jgi:hypothetical protein
VVAPLLLGLASGGASALQSIGNYQQGVAAADAANAQTDAQYRFDTYNWQALNNQKLNQWNQQLQIRKLKTEQFYETNKQIGIAYGEGLFDSQLRKNAILEQSMGEKLDAQLRLMQANAANAAKGRTGKRSGVSNMVNNIMAGRDSIRRAEDLGKTMYAADRAEEAMQRRASNDRMNNYYSTGVGVDLNYARPTFGPAPIHGGYTQGPSQLGLFGGLLGAGLSGIGAFNTAAAPQNRILGGYGAA